MRTIKFRAWDTDGKKMYSDILENFKLVCEALKLEDYEFARMLGGHYTNIVIQQFTGLLDKNGKEIYEGDVVKIHNFKITWKHGEPKIDWRIFEVRWNRYLWSFHNSVISKPLADYDTSNLEPYQIEVIGNVYSNPELLKS